MERRQGRRDIGIHEMAFCQFSRSRELPGEMFPVERTLGHLKSPTERESLIHLLINFSNKDPHTFDETISTAAGELEASSRLREAFFHLGALISCGVGVSAFEWSRKELRPVFVKVGKRKILALVPISVLETERRDFKLIRVHSVHSGTGANFTLISRDPVPNPPMYTVCLFPLVADLGPDPQCGEFGETE